MSEPSEKSNVVHLTPRASEAQPYIRTMGELFDWYLDGHVARTCSPLTGVAYRLWFRHMKEAFGDVDPIYLNDDHITDYMRKRRLGLIGRPTSEGKVIRECMIVRSALNTAVKKRRLSPHAKPIFDLPQLERQERFWMTRVQAAEMLRVAKRIRRARAKTKQEMRQLSDLEVFCWVGLFTGQRRNAILGLKFHQNINFATQEIDFNDPLLPKTMKRRARQQMHPIVFRVLRRRFNERPFYRQGVFPPSFDINDERYMPAVAKAMALPITPHTLRHTFITMLLAAGVDLYYVSEIAKVSVETIRQTYAHAVPAVLIQKLKYGMAAKVPKTSGARV